MIVVLEAERLRRLICIHDLTFELLNCVCTPGVMVEVKRKSNRLGRMIFFYYFACPRSSPSISSSRRTMLTFAI